MHISAHYREPVKSSKVILPLLYYWYIYIHVLCKDVCALLFIIPLKGRIAGLVKICTRARAGVRRNATREGNDIGRRRRRLFDPKNLLQTRGRNRDAGGERDARTITDRLSGSNPSPAWTSLRAHALGLYIAIVLLLYTCNNIYNIVYTIMYIYV